MYKRTSCYGWMWGLYILHTTLLQPVRFALVFQGIWKLRQSFRKVRVKSVVSRSLVTGSAKLKARSFIHPIGTFRFLTWFACVVTVYLQFETSVNPETRRYSRIECKDTSSAWRSTKQVMEKKWTGGIVFLWRQNNYALLVFAGVAAHPLSETPSQLSETANNKGITSSHVVLKSSLQTRR